jgi:hypothetical protein
MGVVMSSKLLKNTFVYSACFVSLSLIDLSSVNATEVRQGVRQDIRQGVRQGVRQVSQETATGNSSVLAPKIELSPGYGINISFLKSDEIVEKVWLDNPAIASLDVDGCLRGLANQCEQEGATIIHLRQISPLQVPQLPKTSNTLLTVIARGKSGRKIYLFHVTVGNKNPKYHTVEVIPDVEFTDRTIEFSSIGKEFSGNSNATELPKIIRGLKIAQERRLILPESRLRKRIETFLISLKAGESINNSAHQSGISLRLVNRLIELGNTKIVQPRFVNNVPTTR